MAGTGTRKARTNDLESGVEDREQIRRSDEQAERQDLNQGMSTGTHDTQRHGVNWGASYKSKTTSGEGRSNKGASRLKPTGRKGKRK